MDRKQREGESIVEFSDALYRLARVFNDVNSWKDLLYDVLRTTFMDGGYRSHLQISCLPKDIFYLLGN